MTQPAQTTELDNSAEESPSPWSAPRHSFIRPTATTPGSDSAPAFLVRDGAEPLMLPRLMAWSTLGLLLYVSLQAGSSTYHLVRDARVKPLAASHIRAELHGLLADVARRQPKGGGAGVSASRTDEGAQHAPAIAFVPRSHVPQIKANAAVYECRLWSMFACEPVGRVVEILPGEVEVGQPDTSGGPTRGQYAVMQLTDPHALEAESLRVRDPLESALLAPNVPVDESSPETLL